ncbi:unnamed protein product, partial [Closterium sp. Naga37s-1]
RARLVQNVAADGHRRMAWWRGQGGNKGGTRGGKISEGTPHQATPPGHPTRPPHQATPPGHPTRPGHKGKGKENSGYA